MSTSEVYGFEERRPDFSDTLVQDQLVADCTAEAQNIISLQQMFPSKYQAGNNVDVASRRLGLVTHNVDLVGTIIDTRDRLTALATIALETEDQTLEQQVIDEAALLLGGSEDTSDLVAVAGALRSTNVLACIEDLELRERAVMRTGILLEDPAIIGELQDPEHRQNAIERIIATTSGDYTQWLALLESDKDRAYALYSRARNMNSIAVAKSIQDEKLRTEALLFIVREDSVNQLPYNTADSIRGFDDDDPLAKAQLFKRYMELTHTTGCATDLAKLIPLIQDIVHRTYFEAALVELNGDAALGDKVESFLEVHAVEYQADTVDEIHAHLARGLGSLLHAYSITNDSIRYDVISDVIVNTRATEVAWQDQDGDILRRLVVTYQDMELALRMINDDPHGTLADFARTPLINIAVKAGSIDPLLQVTSPWRRDEMLVEYFTRRGDIDLLNSSDVPEHVKRLATGNIATKRRDPELARRAGDRIAEARILDMMVAQDATERETTLEGATTIVEEDPSIVLTTYWQRLNRGDISVKELLAESIRTVFPHGERHRMLTLLATRSQDTRYAFEALYDIRGTINGVDAVNNLTSMLRVIRHPEVPLQGNEFYF